MDHRKYDNSVAVLVKADKDSPTGTGTLYIGAGKSANGEGYAFFDNFQLFYMGDKQWYLDATNTSTSEFTTTKNDNDNYHTPSGINHNPGVMTIMNSPLFTTYAATSTWTSGKALFFLAH